MIRAGSVMPVEEVSQVAVVRRTAARLAEHLGFSDVRAGRLAIVVSELATNLAKHARRGEMLLHAVDEPSIGQPAVEVLALDRGPGIADVARSRADGFSTSGTLGQGLGAIERQSDLFQVYTQPAGTAILARVVKEASATQAPRLVAGGVRVNAPGEQVCGDDWTLAARTDRVIVMLADGLGHGLAAHDAARQAVATFRADPERAPIDLIRDLHVALHGTRGAAVTAVALELERGIARCCGVGNVSAVVLPPGGAGRHSLVSHNGTAGHGQLRPVEAQYPFPPQSMLVMHSDGLQSHWDFGSYPGLRVKHPSLIAGVLYRDFSRHRDDVSVVVVQERPAR